MYMLYSQVFSDIFFYSSIMHETGIPWPNFKKLFPENIAWQLFQLLTENDLESSHKQSAIVWSISAKQDILCSAFIIAPISLSLVPIM